MTINEFQSTISNLGLFYKWSSNNKENILTIYQQTINHKYKLDKHYFHPQTLGYKEVDQVNLKFKKLLNILRRENLKIISVEYTDNAVIKSMSILLRSNSLEHHKHSNFEIQDFGSLGGGKTVDYNAVLPYERGYGITSTDYQNTDLFSEIKLEKHELDLVIKNVDMLFKLFKNQSYDWILNLAIYSNEVQPLETAFKKGILNPENVIGEFFSTDPKFYKTRYGLEKTLDVLLSQKVNIEKYFDLWSKKDLNNIIIENTSLYGKLLENWEFEIGIGHNLLVYMLKHHYYKQFKQFINKKDSKKYIFDEWFYFSLKYLESTLARTDLELSRKIFNEGWIEIDQVGTDLLIDFLIDSVETRKEENLELEVLVIDMIIKIKPNLEIQWVLEALLESSEKNDLNIGELITPFLKIENIYLKGQKGEIMKYLDSDSKLTNELLNDIDFIQMLIDNDKVKYIPRDLQNLFMF